MRALVTGSSGFIGHGVASALEAMAGLDVLGLDRSKGDGRLCTVTADLMELADAVPAGYAPGIVIHCAGITTAACEADAELAWRVNVEGTRSLLAWCGRVISGRAAPLPKMSMHFGSGMPGHPGRGWATESPGTRYLVQLLQFSTHRSTMDTTAVHPRCRGGYAPRSAGPGIFARAYFAPIVTQPMAKKMAARMPPQNTSDSDISMTQPHG